MNINVLHKTDYNHAVSILENGFDLNKFGFTSKKSGQGRRFAKHAKGVYFTEDYGLNPEMLLDHPWDHKDRGVIIFCSVVLNKPYLTRPQINGIFYQDHISQEFGNLSGAGLTIAMQKSGYDGIYIENTGEVVVFDPLKITINTQKTNINLQSYLNWKGSKSFKEWLKK